MTRFQARFPFSAPLAVVLLCGLILWGCDSTSVQPDVLDVTAEADVTNGDPIPGQFIVVLDEAKLGKAPEEVINEFQREEDLELLHRYGATLQGFAAKMSEEQADRLGRDERVKYVEQDRMIVLGLCDSNPTHPKCNNDPGDPPSSTQSTPWGIERVNGGANGSNKVACVLDTGVDLNHPDLNVDTSLSRSFVGGSAEDGHGHGTHVAGTIAALNNSEGVVGVAAGAKIIAIKVLTDGGSGTYSQVMAGVDYAKTAGCDVANMSLGGPFSQALNDAVQTAANSVPFVLAAGNESRNASNYSPASANGANIYTISAFEKRRDRFAPYSNYGNPPVDYAAPGSSIRSTYKNGGYATMSGTSMASPHVAGILLLGPIRTDGNVRNDPDRDADPIAYH